MDSHIDRQRAMDLAREYGLEISFDNPKPGVIIKAPGGVEQCSFYDLFPELQPDQNHYVKVEECIIATYTSAFSLTEKNMTSIQGVNDFTVSELLKLAA